MYGDTSSSLDDDEEAKKHMYPPRDTRVHNFRRKDDSFGLGYVAGKGLAELVRDDPGIKGNLGPNISGTRLLIHSCISNPIIRIT